MALIHYRLNGEAWSADCQLADTILGGTELEGTDAGYGPFRYLAPADVRATAQALARISPEELWQRFDANRVTAAEIYPSGWTGDTGDRDYAFLPVVVRPKPRSTPPAPALRRGVASLGAESAR